MDRTATYGRALVFCFWLAGFLEAAGLNNLLGQELLEHTASILLVNIIFAAWYCACILVRAFEPTRSELILQPFLRFFILCCFILVSNFVEPLSRVSRTAVLGAAAISWMDSWLIPSWACRLAGVLERAGSRVAGRRRVQEWLWRNERKLGPVLALFTLPLAVGCTVGMVASVYFAVSEMREGNREWDDWALMFASYWFFSFVLWGIVLKGLESFRQQRHRQAPRQNTEPHDIHDQQQ